MEQQDRQGHVLDGRGEDRGSICSATNYYYLLHPTVNTFLTAVLDRKVSSCRQNIRSPRQRHRVFNVTAYADDVVLWLVMEAVQWSSGLR